MTGLLVRAAHSGIALFERTSTLRDVVAPSARCTEHCLGRLAEGSQERASHPIAVFKTSLTGDHVHRQSPLFHERTRGFDS